MTPPWRLDTPTVRRSRSTGTDGAGGLAGVLWSSLEFVLVMQDFIYLSAGDWSGALGIVQGLLEIAPVCMMWLVFFPPAGYRRWIEGAAAS